MLDHKFLNTVRTERVALVFLAESSTPGTEPAVDRSSTAGKNQMALTAPLAAAKSFEQIQAGSYICGKITRPMPVGCGRRIRLCQMQDNIQTVDELLTIRLVHQIALHPLRGR